MLFSKTFEFFWWELHFYLPSPSHHSASPPSQALMRNSVKKKVSKEDKQTSQAPHSAQQGTRPQLFFISQWRWSVLGDHFQRAESFWRCSAGWWIVVSVILGPAEMQRGSLLQELVKEKVDGDTWLAGCHLGRWNLFKSLLKSTRIPTFF